MFTWSFGPLITKLATFNQSMVALHFPKENVVQKLLN